MKIGLRTIKTGIAVTLSLIIAHLLKIESPFLAVIAAIITMQPTVADSWKSGVNRMLGTFIGALIGIIFVYISPANPFLAGIGTITTIVFMNKLGWGEAISIGVIVFIGIFLNTEEAQISHALNRLLDTFIGIGVAVVINYFVYPPVFDEKAMDEIKRVSRDTWKYIMTTLEMLLNEKDLDLKELDRCLQKIEGELNESERLLNLQLKEERSRTAKYYKSKEMLITVKLEKQIYQHLQNIQGIMEKKIDIEVFQSIKEDVQEIKHQIQIIESTKQGESKKQNRNDIRVEGILQIIREVKTELKNNKDINEYPTDETVKMLVFIYNLEQVLTKINLCP